MNFFYELTRGIRSLFGVDTPERKATEKALEKINTKNQQGAKEYSGRDYYNKNIQNGQTTTTATPSMPADYQQPNDYGMGQIMAFMPLIMGVVLFRAILGK